MKVEFWRVDFEDHDLVTPILKQLVDGQATRRHPAGSDWLRLTELGNGTGPYEGDLVKIRMDEAPVIAPLDGPVHELDLERDEGVGEESAFLFDPESSVLAMQRNRYGPSARAWLDFILTAGGNPPPGADIAMVLRRDAWERLSHMQEVKKFRIRLAGIRNPKAFADHGHSLGEVGQLLESFSAPSADIAVSMGRRSGGLNIASVIAKARALLKLRRHDHEDVKGLTVTGFNKDGDKDVFDLITFRMIEEVEVSEAGRHLSYAVRSDALRRAWRARRAELMTTIAAG